jgi:hypothetical protein
MPARVAKNARDAGTISQPRRSHGDPRAVVPAWAVDDAAGHRWAYAYMGSATRPGRDAPPRRHARDHATRRRGGSAGKRGAFVACLIPAPRRRGRRSTERRRSQRAPGQLAQASMGPSMIVDGESSTARSRSSTTRRFNGAVDDRRRRGPSIRRRPRACPCFNGAVDDRRRRGSAVSARPTGARGFNGAVDDRRRRATRWPTVRAVSPVLQWGRR